MYKIYKSTCRQCKDGEGSIHVSIHVQTHTNTYVGGAGHDEGHTRGKKSKRCTHKLGS